jgi:hypothetical protein
MVETLQVAMMMKKDSLSPIPIRFNSHVLALLEGYSKLRLQLGKEATRIAEVQDLRERELDQFRAISEDWLRREQGYRDEVKRLELQLAEARSMEAVIVARSGSLVDRSATARKRFEERVKRLSGSKVDEDGKSASLSHICVDPTDKTRDADDVPPKDTNLTRANTHKNIGSMPRIMDPDQDRLISEQLKPKERKPPQKKLKPRRPPKEEQRAAPAELAKPNAALQERAEEKHTTYVPKGAPGPSRRPTRVELPAYYQGGVDSSPSSSSGSGSSWKTDGNKETRGAPTIKVFARPREQPLAKYDETRRFSFAVGQVDTLPTPAGIKNPDSDGAADSQPHGLAFTSEAGLRPDAPRKTDSSSSQATVIRDTLWEDPATPARGPRDSRNSSTGSRASSDGRTEQDKPRLDPRPFSTTSSTTPEDEQARIPRGDAAVAFPFLPGAGVSTRRVATPARPARQGAAERMPSSSSTNVSRNSSSRTTTSSGPTSPVLPSEAGGSTNAARIAAALAVARGQKREPRASEG